MATESAPAKSKHACSSTHRFERQRSSGSPDDDLGQRIAAFVALQPGEAKDPDVLTRFVADRLSPHKRPRNIHFVTELPRNAMGKVQKNQLA